MQSSDAEDFDAKADLETISSIVELLAISGMELQPIRRALERHLGRGLSKEEKAVMNVSTRIRETEILRNEAVKNDIDVVEDFEFN